MKKNIAYCLLICTAFSCQDVERPTKSKDDTPTALAEEESYNIVSKRGREDLIDNLYAEIIAKDLVLKKVDDNIREIEDGKNDSLKKFNSYDEKNQDYFFSANAHVKEIQDSVLRKTLTALIAKNMEAYKVRTLQYKKLARSIDTKTSSLNDLSLALKISRTLPLIEKYQKENLPDNKSILNLSSKIDQTIKLADTLYKKKTQ
ncbi:hypothetical protein [Pedobacter sp. R-06]|uniref:hypothetical protein n=1 Tax=Pedobacter sp. R-06 TaxID=3404051 RepID=UPI003CEBC829